jgi:acyl-lipid omega-6 desaturase (Delta-12 desaturase)
MSESDIVQEETGLRQAWILALRRFEQPSARKAAVQLADTLLPYLALLALMYLSTRWAWPIWVTLLLAVPTGGFLVRLFIFFHDCCHGSYLRSRTATRVLGAMLGVLTFTPYSEWRHSHGIHHSSSGNLDRRGVGDVWTMTLEEYRASTGWTRLLYRLFRHPLILFGLGPIFLFMVSQRIPKRGTSRRQLMSVLLTDAAIFGLVGLAAWTIGIGTYLLIQIPVMFVAGLGGIWLFYVQHQFDPTYWARSEDWGSLESALQGSSFYKLPPVLQWFSGNIGLHHVHHLRPRIPNYNLQRCLDETPELQLNDPLTLWKSLQAIRLNLWDEACKRLLSFREAAGGGCFEASIR